MKKHTFILLITLSILLTITTNLFATGSNMGGPTQDGSADFPYLIEDLADFNEFASDPNYWNDCIRLETDVNLAGIPYTTAPIAPDTDNTNYDFDGTAFTGHFDGNDYIISNLTIDGSDYCGLFGKIDSNSTITNLSIEKTAITCSGNYVAALVGYNHYSYISNCSAIGTVTGHNNVGILLGFNSSGNITNSYSTKTVNGSRDVGGLVGYNHGHITNCHSTANITGSSDDLGGLVGANGGSINNCYSLGLVECIGYDGENAGGLVGYNHGSITSCYSTGEVNNSANEFYDVGGLIGMNNYEGIVEGCYSTGTVTVSGNNNQRASGLIGANYSGIITNCYSTGTVKSSGNNNKIAGGLIGYNYSGMITNCHSIGQVDGFEIVGGLVASDWAGDITNCYWDVETSGIGNAGDNNYGAIGKTTPEMQTPSTFLDADWDLVTVWNIEDGQTYPLLRKYSAFDTNYDNKVNFTDFADFANHWLDGVEPEPEPEVDNDPPTPNQSQWLVEPHENSGYHIMSAVIATDSATGGNDPVWYKFYVVSGSGIDSGWQLSNEYIYLHSGNTAYQVITCDSIPGTGLPNPANSTAPSEPGATYE